MSERPPLTRDLLLAEVSRSLRHTHPDRAEEMIAEIERALLYLHTFRSPIYGGYRRGRRTEIGGLPVRPTASASEE